jgi:hypothetical protein
LGAVDLGRTRGPPGHCGAVCGPLTAAALGWSGAADVIELDKDKWWVKLDPLPGGPSRLTSPRWLVCRAERALSQTMLQKSSR